MRILQIVVRYPPFTGGVERTVHELSRLLVDRGHSVKVLCAAEPNQPPQLHGVEIERIPFVGKIGNTNLCPKLYLRALREKPDIVHSHLPTAGFPEAAALLKLQRGTPHVLTYNNDLVGRGLKGLLGKLYNRTILPLTLRSADRVVITSSRYEEWSPWLASAKGKIEVIPWGVDTDRFRPTPLPPVPPVRIGFLSVLDDHHDYKGLHLLLEAAADATSSGFESFQLVIGGSGSALTRYVELARTLGLQSRVEFVGFVPEEELPGFYGSLHILALPSVDPSQEGFGLVLPEAMASGRPVITTEVTAVSEVVQREKAGFLVPRNSVSGLSAAIIRILEQPALLEERSKAAREIARSRFSMEYATTCYEKLYESLIDKSRG